MAAEVIQFVPKPNLNRKEPPAFDAYDHRTIDYTATMPPADPDEPAKEPA